MSEVYKQILAAAIGGLFLGGLVLWTDFVFWFNILISGGIALGAYFTIPSKKNPAQIEIAPGVTQADFDAAASILSECRGKLINLSHQCANREVAGLVREMGETLENLSLFFRKSPENLRNADMFLNNFVEKSCDLVAQYVRMEGLYPDGSGKKELAPVEDTIRKTHAGFRDFHTRCLRNELTDLEVSAETLKAMAEMEFPDFDR